MFRDEDSIPKGKKWKIVIAESLASCTTVLVFWSVAASDSKTVEEEYGFAIEQGKDIVPVLLDDTALPSSLSQYQWVDFRPMLRAAMERAIAMMMLSLGTAAGVIGAMPGQELRLFMFGSVL